jgi:tyrosyl-tRNA synthetase
MLSGEIPFKRIMPSENGETLEAQSIPTTHLLVETGLAKSNGDARRLLQQGGVTVNGRRLGADENRVPREEALAGGYFLVRKGAREMALVKVD